MVLIGAKKELVLLLRCKGQRWFHLICFGRKRHYRKDGSCVHVDEVLANVRPNKRQLVKVQPFGGKRE